MSVLYSLITITNVLTFRVFVYLFLHFCYVCIWRKVWRWCIYTSVYALCWAERCTLIVMYKSRQMTERCTRCCVKFPTVTLIGICLNRTPSRQGHSARMKRNKRGEKNTVQRNQIHIDISFTSLTHAPRKR